MEDKKHYHYHYSMLSDMRRKQFVTGSIKHKRFEPLITTMELTKALKVSRRCLLRMAHICFPQKVFKQGMQTYWNEKECRYLRQAFRANKELNYDKSFFLTVFPRQRGVENEQWTTKEIADTLGIKPYSVSRIANKVLDKEVQKGKTTYYCRKELKKIFTAFISGNNNQYTQTWTTCTLTCTQFCKATWRKNVKADFWKKTRRSEEG